MGLNSPSLPLGYPVEFVSAPTVVEVDKGGSNVIECVFSGLPTPKVTWQRNGVDLPIYNSDGSFNHVVSARFDSSTALN